MSIAGARLCNPLCLLVGRSFGQSHSFGLFLDFSGSFCVTAPAYGTNAMVSALLPLMLGKQGRIYGNPVADGWAGAGMQKPLVIQQGRIQVNPVADSWAGAALRKPLGIQKCDGLTDLPTYRPTYRPTRQGVESRARD